MAYSITIAGIDRTADVLANTLQVEDVVNDQQNTCSFALIDRSGNGTPDNEDEVIITLDDDSILFGGYILTVEMSKQQSGGAVQSVVRCVDYARLLDQNVVHQTYEDMTDKEIIEAIVNEYCAGLDITTTNVEEGVTIEQISFNYVQPSQAIRRIADLTGRNWYIDYNKDVHYFSLLTNTAPFDIDSTENGYFNLRLVKDTSQLKNRVYVRGGTYLSDTTTYSEKGDGIKTTFVLPDKPHSVSVAVNGSPETVGIKNVDTSGFDWYLNYQEKYIEQDAGGTILTASDTLEVSYQYDVPILVAVEDSVSIEDNGVKEFAIFDKGIRTTEGARSRASAELTDYANDIVEGQFSTYTNGFISGQYININLSEYGVNQDYIVQKVVARSIGGGKFVYDIAIASSKTMGIIRFLIELLEANKNLIELDDDEVIDELFQLTDSLNADSLDDDLTIDSAGAYRTWATDSLEETETRAIWNLFEWGGNS